jgi:hypothetical protein
LQPEAEIAVHPERREEVEGKEPNGATVGPGTPEVAVPAKQPHNTITQLSHEDLELASSVEYGRFVKKLAAAVILRGLQDLGSSNGEESAGGFKWFFGIDKDSLKTWTNLAGLSVEKVRRRARELSSKPELLENHILRRPEETRRAKATA